MAGQTINDRLLAARHSLAGQGLAKSVCKATTEEMIGPKKKHLDYLVHCTNEPNVSIPHLANLLVERTQNANWVVVYKSLLTAHHLLAYGNERFMQYLASSNSTFNLSNFLDKGGVQGTVGARIGYDMSPFIRRYAKYLNDKAMSYRNVAFDFCKVKRGKEEGSLRTMNADKLLKTLPSLQAQLDSLLEFDCQANDLSNGVINMCFMLLFRDLIRLFACYNDGIINLLEKYFDMNKKQCKDALDLYKKFLVRMDRVGEFLKVAENVGIDKGDIPDLTKAPSSLLEALEGHLASLEGRKGSAANTPTQSTSNQKNVKSAVSALSSTSSSFGTAAASTRFDSHTNGIDDAIAAQALAEEEAAMNQYRTKVGSPTGGAAAATNPFLSSPVNSQANIVDLFGGGPSAGSNQLGEPAVPAHTKASDDLLQLGNPFADMFGGAAPAQPNVVGQPSSAGNNGAMWSMGNGFNGSAQAAAGPTTGNSFVSDSNFSSVFGATEPIGSNYYLQAALDASMPNPFLLTDSPAQPPPHPSQSGDSDFGCTGIGVGSDHRTPPTRPGPPQRPPPPQAGGGVGVSLAASPARPPGPSPTAAAAVAAPKSAFDDLNDSIRMALGSNGSPARTAPAGAVHGSGGAAVVASGPAAAQFNQNFMQHAPSPSPQPPLPIYSSPAKQSASGLGFDALGDVLKPTGSSSLSSQSSSTGGPMQSGNNIIGTGQHHTMGSGAGSEAQHQLHHPAGGKVLTGDLESSLASLAENLTINKSASAQVKSVQWNSPKTAAKTASWTPQPMAATTGAGYRPMAQGMTVSPAPSTIHHPFNHASYNSAVPPYQQHYQQQQGMPARPPPMGSGAPMMGGVPAPSMMQMQQQQPPMMMPQQTALTEQNGKNVQLDPFGAF